MLPKTRYFVKERDMHAPPTSTTHKRESYEVFVKESFSSWSKALERWLYDPKQVEFFSVGSGWGRVGWVGASTGKKRNWHLWVFLVSQNYICILLLYFHSYCCPVSVGLVFSFINKTSICLLALHLGLILCSCFWQSLTDPGVYPHGLRAQSEGHPGQGANTSQGTSG